MTVINNYFSRARLDYYTKAQGLEKEPKLPPKLAGPLHKIIMGTNLNPVKVGEHRPGVSADLQDCWSHQIFGASASLLGPIYGFLNCFFSQWSIKQDF